MSDRRSLPRGYQITKNPVTLEEDETLPGWAVLGPPDDDGSSEILGHGLKTRTEAIIFAQGCETGKRQLARMF
jgi:hypothetical protein